MLTKGISLLPSAATLEEEFWYVIDHSGSSLPKKSAKWLSTAVEPELPGTLGWRIGERSLPFLMLKLSPGRGIDLRASSGNEVYAVEKLTRIRVFNALKSNRSRARIVFSEA